MSAKFQPFIATPMKGSTLRRAHMPGHVDLVPGHINFCGYYAWRRKWFFSLGMHLFAQNYT